MSNMSLVLHHLHVSQSERIIWLCEELDVSYKLKCYERDPNTMLAPEEYKDISPLKTAPVIEDMDNYTPNPQKVAIAESQACIEWIVRKYGQGRLIQKPWESNWKEWLFYWHFTNGSLQPALGMKFLTSSISPDQPIKAVEDRVSHCLSLLEDRLSTSKWLVGNNFTAADIMVVFPLTTMRMFTPLDLSDYPNILRYLKDIGERPAYKRAMEKGDPGMEPLLGGRVGVILKGSS